jgi:tRNA(fMet)-specific endonuclease VapC
VSVLIDTNIAIFLSDGRAEIKERVGSLNLPPVISLISLVELESGIWREPDMAELRRLRLDAMLTWVQVLPFEYDVVTIYSDVVRRIGFSRSRLLDRLIASTALAADLTLATTNGPDFRDIPGLKLEVWPHPAQ